METRIRPDFESVKTQLTRLLIYSEQAHEFNIKDWSHLKNQEDYDKVYDLESELLFRYEKIYSDGRNLAVWISQHFCSFNDVGSYPTLKSFVEYFEGSWVYHIEELKAQTKLARDLIKHKGSPWAIEQMVGIYESEIKILEATLVLIDELKASDLYLRESGQRTTNDNSNTSMSHHITFNSPANVQIGNQNTQSIVQTFNSIIEKIDSSPASPEEKAQAKSLLKAFIEHPLVTSVIGGVAGGLVGLAGK
jgi:hypothetical protein